MISEYSKGHQEGIAEAVKRIESFKNRVVLQMRIKQTLSDEQYEFVCKLVDAEIKLLNMKPSPSQD